MVERSDGQESRREPNSCWNREASRGMMIRSPVNGESRLKPERIPGLVNTSDRSAGVARQYSVNSDAGDRPGWLRPGFGGPDWVSDRIQALGDLGDAAGVAEESRGFSAPDRVRCRLCLRRRLSASRPATAGKMRRWQAGPQKSGPAVLEARFMSQAIVRSLTLAGLLLVGLGATGECPPGSNDFGGTGPGDVRSEVYRNSVGFWLPEGVSQSTVADQLQAEVEQLAISAFVQFGLGISSSWLLPIDIIRGLPSVGGAYPSYDHYVRTKASSGWSKSVDICPGDEVLLGVAYDSGGSSELDWRPPHFDGLTSQVRRGPGTPVRTITILEPDEETDSAPFPNFFIIKAPISLAGWLDPDPLPGVSHETFTIGAWIGSPATVRVDIGLHCGDGVPDESDECPDDPNKTEPGICGCGHAETPGCATGYIYWAKQREGISGRTAWIRRAELDGRQVETVITSTHSWSPYIGDVVVDRDSAQIYWLLGRTTFAPEGTPRGMIQRASLDGSNVETLLSLDYPTLGELALDPIGRKMYWTYQDGLSRANLDGSGLETIVPESQMGDGEGLALDVARNRVYWADPGWTFLPTLIRQASLDGSGIVTIHELTGTAVPYGMAIDLEAQRLYWADGWDAVIQCADTSGAAPETLVQHMGAIDIALDIPHGKMYWTGSEDGEEGQAVWRANLDGTEVEKLLGDDRAGSISILVSSE